MAEEQAVIAAEQRDIAAEQRDKAEKAVIAETKAKEDEVKQLLIAEQRRQAAEYRAIVATLDVLLTREEFRVDHPGK